MIKSLTSLRGIFIILMFFWHCMNLYPGGAMAASFFFVLSGFSLTIGYKDKLFWPEFSYKMYLSRRCVKFYPLHWLCLIAALVLQMSFSVKEIPVFLTNAFLLHSWVPLRDYYFSYNAVSWYLSDTLFFAAVFPFLCRLIVKSTNKRMSLIGVLFGLFYALVAIYSPSEWHHALLYINPLLRLTDFVIGIYLALWFIKLKKKEEKNETSRLIEWLALIAIILVAVEPYLVDGEVRLMGPVYWPLIGVLLITASLSSINGGGQNSGIQAFANNRRTQFFDIHDSSTCNSLFINDFSFFSLE